MRTTATARFVRVSARKARLVLDQIRGRSVSEALATLQYTPRAAARLVEKVLRSAVANAEHNHQVRDLDALRVHHAIADGGPSLKRVQPRAVGRAFFIKHRTSHLTVGVSDELNGTLPVQPPRHMRRPPRREEPSGAASTETAESRPEKTRTRTRTPARKAPAAQKRPTRQRRGSK
jgi:large subunit ribosomal protein L22